MRCAGRGCCLPHPSRVTIVKDAAGWYLASFVVRATDEVLPSTDSGVGIDLGLTHFAVLSDGTKVAAAKFLRRAARKRLKRLQQDLSRRQRGSRNREEAVVKVSRAHARVADTRRDWQHKLSTVFIRDNQAVYVEDLCVVGLGRTRLAKSVHDAGWASFTGMLEYKAARYGRTFGRVDRFFPSTRMRASRGARSATCSTARFSVVLIFSPANIASRRAGRPRASASATSRRMVSSVIRCLE